ncbi:hypothetical protein MSAN_00868800 [Mycena sanguinolenta]|uniref:DUF6534 domain-containing protein n=1 Tax=Mycena sanguinolenta TaxID=230812 RepID=A0A8H6Z2B9_9AGAR|nr:hypothetical protein MSAN_00868800 [Mycena sanguinolenta]
MGRLSSFKFLPAKLTQNGQFIGACLDFVLMGVLAYQSVNYARWYPEDGRGIRIAVAVLCLLNVLKSAECFASLWIFMIDHFGDIQYDLQLTITGWWDTANPLMVGLLNFYVQCYFCTRLWAISRRWWVVAPIFTLFVFAQVSMILGTYYIEIDHRQQVANWFGAHLSSAFVGDLILSVTTAYFLIRTKKTHVLSSQTARLIHSLIPLTFQTATPPAVVAMFNFIFSQMYRTGHPLLGYVEIGFNQPLPKVYAISMMYTLNVRREIRSRASESRTGDDTWWMQSTDNAILQDVELGQVSRSTQRGTARRVTVTDMFASTHSGDSKLALSNPDQKFQGPSPQ